MTEPRTGAPEGSFRSAFDEMTQLVQRSRYCAAIVRRFLNQDRVVGRHEIDPSAAMAGHVVFTDKPTDGLLVCLEACRAVDEQERAFHDRQRHDGNSEIKITEETLSAGVAELADCEELQISSASTVRRVFQAMWREMQCAVTGVRF